MPVFAWVGAGAAALVVSAFLMLKGGMIERPKHASDGFGPMGTGGSPDGSGIPTLGDDQEDPFKRFLTRDRSGAPAGPEPTQAETQVLSNGDGWSSPEWSPAVTFSSAGDGSSVSDWSPEPSPGARAAPARLPGFGGGYQTNPLMPAPTEGSFVLTPYGGSPIPVPTSDPNVYRVPGTNIKMT